MRQHFIVLILIFCNLFLLSSTPYSQVQTIFPVDSLKNLLASQKEDSNKARTFYLIARSLHFEGSSKESLAFAEKALQLSEKTGYQKGKRFGFYYTILGSIEVNDFSKALNYSYEALKFYRKTKDTFLIGETTQLLGSAYFILEDTVEALIHFKESLAIRKSSDNKLGISQSSNSIGEIYCKQGKFKEAMACHNTALEICSVPGFDDEGWGLAYTQQSIGTVFEKMGDREYTNNNIVVAEKEYNKALNMYIASAATWSKVDRPDALAELDYRTGNIYLKLKKYDLAEQKLQKALSGFGFGGENKDLLNGLYFSLSNLDSVRGNYRSAYNNYKKYVAEKELLLQVHLIRSVEKLKIKSEIDKKELQIELLAAEKKIQEEKNRQQQQNRNILYSVAVIFILAGSYGFSRFRRKKQQQALAEERLRISRELHDEVGATLSGIAMYSHLGKDQISRADTDAAINSLSVMQQSSGEMVIKLNDIVWLIKPDEETFQKLVQRLEDFAIKMGMLKNMKTQVSFPADLEDWKLSAENRRNIYLFCKEAINNAVKYSEASQLLLSITLTGSLLQIIVEDNGKGFDAATIKKGNGLDNMHKRASDMKGIFTITSSPGNGCRVQLQAKITRRGIVN